MSGVLNSTYNALAFGCNQALRPFRWVGAKAYNGFDSVLPQNAVTGYRELRLFGIGMERLLGNGMYSSMILSQGGKTTNNALQKQIEDIGGKLAKKTKRTELDYQFTVVDQKQVNAWALPNGKIAIYQGLIDKINEAKVNPSNDKYDYSDLSADDKIAAVLAHEAIHADARHTAKRFEVTIILHVALFALRGIASIFFSSKLAEAKKEEADAAGVGNQDSADEAARKRKNIEAAQGVSNLVFKLIDKLGMKLYLFAGSRAHEHQADTYGMALMKEAGYDPKAALWLQDLFKDQEGGEPSKLMRYTLGLFRSHPWAVDRFKANEAKLEELAPKNA